VILSRARPEGLSALNILAGTVREVRAGEGPGALVSVDTAAGRVLARITRRSVAALDLAPGARVHAVIKTVAVAPDAVGGAG
jgi:molybdate transport system ATP-binding protein